MVISEAKRQEGSQLERSEMIPLIRTYFQLTSHGWDSSEMENATKL